MINDTDKCDQDGFFKKRKLGEKQQPLPYPNPIKLEEADQFVKKQSESSKEKFFNAADMMQGVSLNLQDIKPDEELDKEIFPTELSQQQASSGKDVFTPPNHQQMRFGGQ